MTGARNPQPRLRAWERLAGASCLCLCMAAGVSAGLNDMSALPYARLSTPAAERDTAVDSRTFAGTDACAWLEVTGTSISYPVMILQPEMPDDFYLTHDAWGVPSIAGCPYLDRRVEPEARHLLVYAHSGLTSGLMFGPLRLAYLPERFSTLGDAVWKDRSGAVTVFRPLCAITLRYSALTARRRGLQRWPLVLRSGQAPARPIGMSRPGRAHACLRWSPAQKMRPAQRGAPWYCLRRR